MCLYTELERLITLVYINKSWNQKYELFFSYSTEVFFLTNGSYVQTQKDWIMADLAAANLKRDRVPWVIAFGHRPLYCSNDDGDDCTLEESQVRLG